MDSPERVWIAASSSAARRGLEAVVSAHPPLVPIGSSSLGKVDWLQFHPDLVLLEASGGELQGLDLPSEAPPHLVLTDEPPPGWLSEAVRGCVRGVILRDSTEPEIVAALRALRLGLTVLSPHLLEHLGEPAVRREASAHERPVASLSGREREVLTRMAEGLGNKEIAADLGISEHTVKFHLSSIFNKLDVASRTEAVTAGIRQGLVML